MTFQCNIDTKLLRQSIKDLISLHASKKKGDIISIVFLNDSIELGVQGATRRIPAATQGIGTVTLPIKLLNAFISTSRARQIEFQFSHNYLKCGIAEFNTAEISVSAALNDFNQTLPINPTDLYLLRLYFKNQLATLPGETNDFSQIEAVKKRLHRRLLSAYESLSEYNVSFKEIEQFIHQKIKQD